VPQTDDGITARRHYLRNAATAHLGPIFIERHIADPLDLVLDLPMLPDQAQQPLGISLIQAKAGDPIAHFVALLFRLFHGDAALYLADLGQPRPVTVSPECRADGQPALLEAATPAVDRLCCSRGLCQRVSLLEGQLNTVQQLGWVSFDQHHLVPATVHDTLGDGALGKQGIHGEHPSLDDQGAQHVLQDWDLIGLVRHGLLP
jgi:hypothetical protein